MAVFDRFFFAALLPLFMMFSLGAIDEIFRENISEIPEKSVF